MKTKKKVRKEQIELAKEIARVASFRIGEEKKSAANEYSVVIPAAKTGK